MPPDPAPSPRVRPVDETLADRVRHDGPLRAAAVWTLANDLLDALMPLHARGLAHGGVAPANIVLPFGVDGEPASLLAHLDGAPSVNDPTALRADLRQLGASLWFALTGEPPDTPPNWSQLERAGITPDLGALPVLLARTLAAEPPPLPPDAPALRDHLKMLASLRSAVPVCADMPPRAPGPDPAAAPTPDGRPPVPPDHELWTRTPAQLAAPGRRRGDGAQVWNTLILLAAGGVAGFFGGMLYEKSHETPTASGVAALAAPAASTPAAIPSAMPVPTPVNLAPAQPVGPGGIAARLERIKTLQPDVADALKYAREIRRVATLPVTDPSFPSDAELAALRARFDWTDPKSPNARRTPLLIVLGYDDAGQEASQTLAEAMSQGLARTKIKSPIYTCGLGAADKLAEVQTAGVNAGQFVEVWVAFTLF